MEQPIKSEKASSEVKSSVKYPIHFTDAFYMDWIITNKLQPILDMIIERVPIAFPKRCQRFLKKLNRKLLYKIARNLWELCEKCKSHSIIHGDAWISNILLPGKDGKKTESKEKDDTLPGYYPFFSPSFRRKAPMYFIKA